MELPASALLQELEDATTTDRRRLDIGAILAELGDPRPGVGTKDGLPAISWLPVNPGGTVEIKRLWIPDTPDEEERVIPVGEFRVDPFYIARYPVTVAQFQAFVDSDEGIGNLKWWRGVPDACQRQELAVPRTNVKTNPRDSISWYQSIAFARWLDHRMQGVEIAHPAGNEVWQVGDKVQIRLPAEWEWQWAAQNGVEARRYPWGNRAEKGHANTVESALGQAIAVGMYPHGAAACGAMDMAGNLMEWCANDKVNLGTIDVTSAATKTLRGGDWAYGIENATCSYADDEVPSGVDALNGCRLVLGKKLYA